MVSKERQAIIKKLDVEEINYSEIFKLLALLPIESHKDVLLWMEDCIGSLFYKPNRRCLVFTNNDEMESLPFEISPFYSTIDKEDTYKFFTCYEKNLENMGKSEYKEFANLVMSDCFKVDGTEDLPTCEKRLASFVSYVSEWKFTTRKEFIVVDIKDFDYNKFLHEIHTLSLWREVFFNFKNRNNAISSNL